MSLTEWRLRGSESSPTRWQWRWEGGIGEAEGDCLWKKDSVHVARYKRKFTLHITVLLLNTLEIHMALVVSKNCYQIDMQNYIQDFENII